MVEADHSISRHILKWETIIDPEDGMRECRAHASGIDFYIWHSIGKRPFGLTAYRQLPDGTNEQVHSGIGIAWYGTRRKCMAQAEARRRQARDTGVFAMLKRFLVIALIVLSQSALAQQQVFIRGEGDTSCATWTREHDRGSNIALFQEVCVYGFVSGFNTYSGYPILGREIETSALAAWVGSYCASHPLDSIAQAADNLVREIKARAGVK